MGRHGLTRPRGPRPPALRLLLEDTDLIAADKPPGLSSVHDANRPSEQTAVELLESTHGKILTVHRIDRETSGVLLAARNVAAHRHLSAQFEARSVRKVYRCLVRGNPNWDSRRVDSPLRPNAGRAYRTIIDKAKGKPASTVFTVAERFRGMALVVAEPEQGRRHQIRAHLEQLGLPIVCDPLYGDERPLLLSELKRGYRSAGHEERPLLDRLGLHAAQLTFVHPSGGDTVTVTAPLATDIQLALKQLRRWAPL